MNRNMIKTMCTLSVIMLVALGSANATTLFQDTFSGTGALGAGWESWTNLSSGAVHGQVGGSYVFDHTGTDWAEAAVQSDPVYITAYDAVDFKFHIKDFGGSDVSNSVNGATSFMVAEGEEPVLDNLLAKAETNYPLDGLVLKVPHNAINLGSYPDAASDPRTWVEIWKKTSPITATLLGKIVVQATNDFTLVVSMNYDAWSVDVEGASFWVAEGWSHGLHGYDLWTWTTGARLRMESWNESGNVGPASIDGVAIEATPKAIPFLFEDTFDGTGALGADWVSWQEAASGANPGQTNGCYVFDNTDTLWAQAAVQTTTTVDIASTVNATARFHVKDYSGSTEWDGMAGGITSFIFAEYDPVFNSLYSTSIDGIVLSVEHQAINGGAVSPRTWVKIKKTDDTELGVVVVQSTNDYTMALIMTTNTWEFGVEGATYWIDSGTTSGLHGYDLSTWAGGACLRMESWNAEGDWRPAKIDSAAIEVPPPYYEKWTLDNFLLGTNALRTADVDMDGMGNLLEYAIGGNPRVYDTVVLPTASVVEDTGTNWLEFVYNRRFDHVARDLDYGVILSDDLVAGVWTNIGMSAETGSGMINAAMESVTNRISTVDDVKFSRLEVTEN